MKITDVVKEDITRRGFLQGAGAAAVAGAAGGVSAAEYESKEIGNWEFSVRNSKFDGKSVSPATTQYTPGGHDGNQGHNGGGKFRYDGKSLTYWSGSGGPVSKFDQIQPNTVVRYSIDNGPIKSTRSDNIGSVDFTKEIPALMNANKIEIAYTYLNNRSKNTGPAENSLLVNGFKEIYHIFKNEKVVKESVKQGVAEGWLTRMLDPEDSPEEAYELGQQAARDGYSEEDNPYEEGWTGPSDAMQAWHDGWTDARSEYKDDEDDPPQSPPIKQLSAPVAVPTKTVVPPKTSGPADFSKRGFTGYKKPGDMEEGMAEGEGNFVGDFPQPWTNCQDTGTITGS